MTLNPDVQRKAQQMLDEVVGSNRLPLFSDRSSLPYIDALVRESLRWKPVVPLGIPHRCIKDDEYNGYLIPNGAIVMVNQWYVAILQLEDLLTTLELGHYYTILTHIQNRKRLIRIGS